MPEFGSGNSKVKEEGGNLNFPSLKINQVETAPSTATSPGSAGDIVIAADGIYLCTATDVWVKAAMATF